ncbi:cupin domain-containing protein [Microbacterium sp.]|uniref:cupin domain-containing protein n=1 Tax=Microbacterium sp. TaxID=51671 RepID=UPI003A924AC7
MSGYDVMELGGLDTWLQAGGDRPGKQFVDKEIPTEFIGVSANAATPGGESGYWHAHSKLEEVYVFLAGRGQMAVGDDVVDVQAGTVVRVGQDVMRAWRALPDSHEDLRWLCIRSGGEALKAIGRDGALDKERPYPWAE